MMLSLQNAVLGFGGPALLDGIALEIQPGERLGLVGRNGSGKSTLLRVLTGEQALDSGVRVLRPGLRIAGLPQAIPDGLPGTVGDLLQAALPVGLETWEQSARMDALLRATALPVESEYAILSAGMKRRVLLARCLICEPDLLLLDEPTNHLDLPAIRWLEELLLARKSALLFITHDRMFLQNLATRILDLERGRLSSWDCDYQTYLQRKEDWLLAEEKQQAVFDKKLSLEESWIRQGIKARRTRNEGRVRKLLKMREEHRLRRERIGNVRLQTDTRNRSGARVIKAEAISFRHGDTPVIEDFSIRIERGDKFGIVGPNGAGKSTLIQLLLGKRMPDSGSLELGTHLQIAYFDQLREQLNPELSVQDNVADGADSVEINGRSQHIVSYLKDFLFPADRARSPVSMLSGGERNRLLLARLFTRPFNLLVMDEPTNDLDLETLELLEEMLADYDGTLLLVSHDRAFLDNVVTDLLILEGDGRVHPLVGGYAEYKEWKARRDAAVTASACLTPTAPADRSGTAPQRPAKAAKLTNRERAELAALPAQIEALENEQAALMDLIASPGFYQQPQAAITTATQRLSSIESEILGKYERWDCLDGR